MHRKFVTLGSGEKENDAAPLGNDEATLIDEQDPLAP
jgi:hypothetical protein